MESCEKKEKKNSTGGNEVNRQPTMNDGATVSESVRLFIHFYSFNPKYNEKHSRE